MRILPVLALSAALIGAGCTDPYGRPDPAATALLGAGIGAAAGLAIAGSQRSNRYDAYPRGGYGYNRGGYYGGGYNRGYYGGPPRGYYGRPYGYGY